ncbi:MAG: hypothetical protein ACRET2_08985 [Steroidobacteraceae bacterium]
MTEEHDLFGPIPAGFARPSTRGRGPQGGKHYVTPRGYAAPPGTGPAGETCGSCKHCGRMRQAKRWIKCLLMRARWSHGRATDILARSPACSKWESPT